MLHFSIQEDCASPTFWKERWRASILEANYEVTAKNIWAVKKAIRVFYFSAWMPLMKMRRPKGNLIKKIYCFRHFSTKYTRINTCICTWTLHPGFCIASALLESLEPQFITHLVHASGACIWRITCSRPDSSISRLKVVVFRTSRVCKLYFTRFTVWDPGRTFLGIRCYFSSRVA